MTIDGPMHVQQMTAPARTTVTKATVDKNSELYKACIDFEAILIKQMLTAMKRTVPTSGFLDGGFAEEVYEDMLYDEYAQAMARSAGFGLSTQLYLQLSGQSRVS